MTKQNHMALMRFACAALMIAVAVSQVACTEEKAKAIQVAAQTFSSEAQQAVAAVKELYLNDIASRPVDAAEHAKDIVEKIKPTGSGEFTPEELGEVLKGLAPSNPASASLDEHFNLLEKSYLSFASMFDSLSQGYLFSKDAVKKSEKHAVNLTVQLVNIANQIKAQPFKITGRRTLLVLRINEARQVADEDQRNLALTSLADQVAQLAADEKEAKDEAILKCLRAAEAGRHVADLIRNYETLSLGNILAQTGVALGFVKEITGSENVEAMLTKYNGIADSIKKDPYWSEILDAEIRNPKP